MGRAKNKNMGKYINRTPKGPLPERGKGTFILEEFEEVSVKRPSSLDELPKGKGLICVVENGPFDAAAYIYNESELRGFSEPDDPRSKTWIIVSEKLIKEYCLFAIFLE